MHFAKQNALAYCRRRIVKLPDGLPIGEKGQMKDEFEVRLRDQPNELFRREKNNQLCEACQILVGPAAKKTSHLV